MLKRVDIIIQNDDAVVGVEPVPEGRFSRWSYGLPFLERTCHGNDTVDNQGNAWCLHHGIPTLHATVKRR